MSTEAMRKALEALEYHTEQTRPIERTQEAMEALRAALAAPQAQPKQAAQAHPVSQGDGWLSTYGAPQQAAHAQPKAGQDWRMRLAGIAAECSDPDTTNALDALLSETDAPSPAAPVVAHGWKLVPVEPTHAQAKAAADAWLDCGSKLMLNKALAAVRAGIAAAPSQADQPAAQEAGRAVALYTAPAPAQRMSEEQIETGREAIFSTENPFCPCDSKTMRKAVRWAEYHLAAAWGVKLEGDAA